uniref:Uncharacterized protein LOC114339392 n=1 Tax=Diabrotica virgifera virgifera TaxID=50390 RepID=A0A6P7G9P9_DIAVI
MRHSIYYIGLAAILILVQFLRWRKTVVKFPSEVRKMSLNLKCAGTKVYNRILQECKIIKMLCYLNLVVSMIAAGSLTPFIGDESDFFIYIAILDEYFPNYKNGLKYLCVPGLFCIGYTLTVPLFFCTHYVSHLKFQFTILNEFLKQMNEGEIFDQNYQQMIFLRLKLCMQIHNNIRNYGDWLMQL